MTRAAKCGDCKAPGCPVCRLPLRENGGAGESGGLMNLHEAPAPAIPDSSDRVIALAKAARVQGWTVAEWMEYIERHPDAALPAGVGGAIVARLVRVRDLLQGNIDEPARVDWRYYATDIEAEVVALLGIVVPPVDSLRT